MKKTIFITLFFLSFLVEAQEKCYCKLVDGYTELAKKYQPTSGEQKKQVPYGQELWIKMDPAASWNKRENEGCRLRSGDFYVTDTYGNPIRAWDCGNTIIEYVFFVTIPQSTNYNSQELGLDNQKKQENKNYQKKPCNCPDDNVIQDRDLGSYRQNMIPWSEAKPLNETKKVPLTRSLEADVRRVPQQQYSYTPQVRCTYAQQTYPELYQQYIQSGGKLSIFNVLSGAEKRRVKKCVSGKTWFGRNWPWVAPTVVGLGVGAYYGLNSKGVSQSGTTPVTPTDDDYIPGGTPGGG